MILTYEMLKSPSSFRDPSGFVFEYNGEIYRSIRRDYAQNYEFLSSSGLLDALFRTGWLIPHKEVELPRADQHTYKVIKPEKIPVISYPFEWCFSQLKEAALLTLRILKLSLEHNMILKDSSGYNVQFKGHRAIFIDTLSFARYEEGQPWNAYRQFCEHFLAPLALASRYDTEFLSLLKLGLEGVPLNLASRILPVSSWFSPALLLHMHLHAYTVNEYSKKKEFRVGKTKIITKKNLFSLIDHLESYVSSVSLRSSGKSEWQHYSKETHYSSGGKSNKASIVSTFVDKINPKIIWDVGANDGFFSRIVALPGRLVLSLDSDYLAIEKNYSTLVLTGNTSVYPLFFNAVNPSPDIGWANAERKKLESRVRPDLIMALALIHHLVISNNIPFSKVAEYFANLSEWVIIEYISPLDEKIALLPNSAGKLLYSRENFIDGFCKYFDVLDEQSILHSTRTLLLLKKRK